MATSVILSKGSSNKELKSYFEAVLKLSQTDNEFPINLDDVWMLAYSDKGKAVRALKANFIEGVDFLLYQNGKQTVFAQNGKNLFDEDSLLPKDGESSKGGRPTDVYMLSIPCLEYFIARKVRPVFEVYRQVFHKVITGKKETIYTDSEVKHYLLDADRQVREAKAESARLTNANAMMKHKQNAIMKLYEEELSYKVNLVSFLMKQGLYQEWEKYYTNLR